MWQVYAKRLGHWVKIGEPCQEREARARVEAFNQALRDGTETKFFEPHAVPLR